MTLHDLSDPAAVVSAVREFDKLGRDTFLKAHGFGLNAEYFLVFDGKHYPAKAIAGVAHGYQFGRALTSPDFRGGNRTVVRHLQQMGFTCEGPARAPAWTTDELILALDLYLDADVHGTWNPAHPKVIELSKLLRSLRIFDDEVRGSDSFRNPNGVALKLHNFSSIDPSYRGAGMAHGASADQEVWDAWAHQPAQLRTIADHIRSTGTSRELASPTDEAEEYEALEGRLLYRLHRKRERDRTLARRKKAAVLASKGELRCEVCDLNPSQLYGETLADLFDVHHVIPLSKAGEGTTRLSDLAVVCPTCHRALHKHQPFLTPAELRKLVYGR